MESRVQVCADRIYTRALQRCLTYLLEDLEFVHVMDAMETADVIKPIILRDIKEQKTTTDKIRTLVAKIQTLDKTVYDAFLESLVKVGQSHLKKKLQAAEIEIRKEIAEAKKKKEQQIVTNEETLLKSAVATPSGAHAGGDTGTLQAATSARRTTDTDIHMEPKNRQQIAAEDTDRDVPPNNTNIRQTYPMKDTTTNNTPNGETTSGELTGDKGTMQNSAQMDTSKPKEETNEETNALATAQYAIAGGKEHADILPRGNVPCSTERNAPGNVDRQVNAHPSEVLPALTEHCGNESKSFIDLHKKGSFDLGGGVNEGGDNAQSSGPSTNSEGVDSASQANQAAASTSTISNKELPDSMSSLSLSGSDLVLEKHFDACFLNAEEDRGVADDIMEKMYAMCAPGMPELCQFDDEDPFGQARPTDKIELIIKHCTSLFPIITENLLADKYTEFVHDTVLIASLKKMQIRPIILQKADKKIIPLQLANTNPINWYNCDEEYFKKNIRVMFNNIKPLRVQRTEAKICTTVTSSDKHQ